MEGYSLRLLDLLLSEWMAVTGSITSVIFPLSTGDIINSLHRNIYLMVNLQSQWVEIKILK
jgi:hypothetical protein